MKLLKNIELPSGFEDTEGYRVDIDDNGMMFYEAYVFTTEMSLETAVSSLESLLKHHYGEPRKTVTGADQTVSSCVLACTQEAQKIVAQITDFGSHCGGYIHATAEWRWGHD